MLLLVTDTSGKNGTVALARAGERKKHEAEILEVVPLAGGTFSAQLVPQIAALLQKHGFTKADIDAFVVVSGPGSFTGLRVGLAAIKALAEILKKPIVAISLLELMAVSTRREGNVVAVLDGGRGEVFFGSYEVTHGSARILREELLSKPEFLSAAQHATIAISDPTLATTARESGLTVVTVENPNSERIARFGWKKLQAGETVSPEKLEANYMRRSDAEMFVKQSS
jgi:tRNA threonylcarbamoyladenosine biosynthesis protein TsaB